MRTSIIRWSIALLLLALVTTNLLAQAVPPRPEGWADAYPAPSAQPTAEPYPPPPTARPNPEPYPWPTVDPYPPPPTQTPQPKRTPGTLSVVDFEPLIVCCAPGPSRSAKRNKSNNAKLVVMPDPTLAAVFVPSPQDADIARRHAERARARLLSGAGWWK